MNSSKYNTIYIEGPDRVGKDTQIQIIRNTFSADLWQVLHYSKPPKLGSTDDYMLYQTSLFNQMFALTALVPKLILNRSHIGEFVYAHYRGYDGSYVFNSEKGWMDPDMDATSVVIILISQAEELIGRNDDQSFYTTVDEARDEIGNFIHAFGKTSFTNKYIINVSGKSIEQVAEEIKAILI